MGVGLGCDICCIPELTEDTEAGFYRLSNPKMIYQKISNMAHRVDILFVLYDLSISVEIFDEFRYQNQIFP